MREYGMERRKYGTKKSENETERMRRRGDEVKDVGLDGEERGSCKERED
jgi:hypothetical protein